MRRPLTAIALAGAVFAPTALAQSPEAQVSADQCGIHARAMHDRSWPGGMASLMRAGDANDLSPERVDERLAALHGELAIMRAQEQRWADLAQALRGDAAGMRAMMRAQGSAVPSASLPERLRRQHVLMQHRLRALGRTEHAVARLYAVLNAGQRARAERALGALTC